MNSTPKFKSVLFCIFSVLLFFFSVLVVIFLFSGLVVQSDVCVFYFWDKLCRWKAHRMCSHHSSKWRGQAWDRTALIFCTSLLSCSPCSWENNVTPKKSSFPPFAKDTYQKGLSKGKLELLGRLENCSASCNHGGVTQSSTGNAVMSKILPTVTSSALRVWE